MHAGEDLPVELLRCHSVEWDRLDGAWPAIGQHAPDHPLRLLDETTDRFIGQILLLAMACLNLSMAEPVGSTSV